MAHIENVKKADRPRFWVTFLFKDLAVGETFKPDMLHLTVVPWFVTELSQEEVIRAFKQNFAGQKPFEITVGELTEFKNRRRVSVNKIKPTRRLKALHDGALRWMQDLEARWAVKIPFVAKDYVPHIRRRRGYNFSESSVIPLKSLNLVNAFRRGDDLRTVIAKVEFDEN
jgi:2'-5' RNA ligase